MWMVSLGKREFLETVAAGISSESAQEARQIFDKTVLDRDSGRIATFWQERPGSRHSFPILAVVDSTQVRDLLAALNSSPKAVSPFSAFCRIIDYDQAEAYFSRTVSALSSSFVEAVGLLSIVEVQLLSAGQIRARQVNPAAARRTLSFVWARGIASGLSPNELENLTDRWLEAHHLCNSPSGSDDSTPSIHHVIPVLKTVNDLLRGPASSKPIERLISAILDSDFSAKDSAWRAASGDYLVNVSLQGIEDSSREERGAYLQRLFEDRQIVPAEQHAAQGFLATRVAPGSLEHLDIILSRGGPQAAFWYVLFATLQQPHSILNAFGGLGRRVVRDVRECETLDISPKADLALEELKILARVNVADLSAKIGHSNEIEVELLPGVSATFRFGRSASAKSAAAEKQTAQISTSKLAADLRQISLLIGRTLADLTDNNDPSIDGKAKRARKPRY